VLQQRAIKELAKLCYNFLRVFTHYDTAKVAHVVGFEMLFFTVTFHLEMCLWNTLTYADALQFVFAYLN